MEYIVWVANLAMHVPDIFGIFLSVEFTACDRHAVTHYYHAVSLYYVFVCHSIIPNGIILFSLCVTFYIILVIRPDFTYSQCWTHMTWFLHLSTFK